MSRVPLFPQEEEAFSNANREESEPQFKRPEFVLIDDRDGKSQYTHFDKDLIPESAEDVQDQEKTSKGTNSLRFVCLLGFIFCAIFGFGMLLGAIAFTILTLVTLFLNKNFISAMGSFWKIFINTFIAGFGFTLGMINPVLGLGLLGLYFSMASDLVEEDLLRKVIRRTFNQL